MGGDAEDINKLTYQKTSPDWSRLVFVQFWNFGNGRGLWTGPRLQSFAVLGFLVLIGPSPVQSQSFSSSGTGLPNTKLGCSCSYRSSWPEAKQKLDFVNSA